MRCLPKPRYPVRIGRFYPVLGGRFLVPFTSLSMAHTTLFLIAIPTALFCYLEAPVLHAGGFTWITIGIVVFALLCVAGRSPIRCARRLTLARRSLVALAATYLTEPGIIPPLVYRVRYLDRLPGPESAPVGDSREKGAAGATWRARPVYPPPPDPIRPSYGYNDSSLRRLAKFAVEGRLDDAQLVRCQLCRTLAPLSRPLPHWASPCCRVCSSWMSWATTLPRSTTATGARRCTTPPTAGACR